MYMLYLLLVLLGGDAVVISKAFDTLFECQRYQTRIVHVSLTSGKFQEVDSVCLENGMPT